MVVTSQTHAQFALPPGQKILYRYDGRLRWSQSRCGSSGKENTVELGYNDIGLCDTSSIASDILWYQLTPHRQPQHYTPRLEQHSFIMPQNIYSLS
jgi:hypothetical protein